ncbi:MAG: PaaI family thioesterase [Telluria sp.]|nr:PaaI family thioesterase [Telluria sp.]
MSALPIPATLPFPVEIPFLNEIGVELVSMGDGLAQVGVDLQGRHMNSWAVAHGGLTMTLLDVAMSLAGRSIFPLAKGAVTVEMNTSFLQPGGTPGGRLIATGKAFHRSTSLCFCEGEVWNGDKLVAKAMGTFKYLRRIEAGKMLLPGQVGD